MTITLFYEKHKTKSGSIMFVERYQEKIALPYFSPPMWRYGVIKENLGHIIKGGLKRKPNVKRLVEIL